MDKPPPILGEDDMTASPQTYLGEDDMTASPQTYQVWPADKVIPRMKTIRSDMMLVALKQRAELAETKTWSLTYWPSPSISLDEYELFVSAGERLRAPSDAARGAIGTTEGYGGSKQRRRCYDAFNTTLCAFYLAELSALTMSGLSGVHLVLDVLDGVRTRLDNRGFVVEHKLVRALAKAEALTRAHATALRKLAVGNQPDGLDGVSLFTCGSMLFSLANRAVSVEHLRKTGQLANKDGQLTSEARQMLKAWPVIGLEIDDTTSEAVHSLQREVRRRRAQATETKKRYQHAGRPAPACGLYV